MSAEKPPSATADSAGDYDPHDHRDVKNPTNNWQSMAHFLKASVGTGVLAMPHAFANSGYIVGFILTIVFGLISLHCLHILIGSMYLLSQRKRVPYLPYSSAMQMAFREGPSSLSWLEPIAIPFVDGFLGLYQFGTCCVYYVFIAETTKHLADEYFVVLDIRTHICILLWTLLLIFSIRSLRILAFFSAFANMLLILGFGVILYYILIDLPPLAERKSIQDIERWPIFFGIAMFSIQALGVFLAVEENMKTPKDFLKPVGIMNVGMAIIVTLYFSIGFFGYWKYGDDSLGSITLNIPQKEIMSEITKLIFAVTIWITYAVQGYVTNDIIWHNYLSKRVTDTSKHVFYELMLRAAFVLLTFICALAVPALKLIIPLVATFCLPFLCFIFPAVMQVCVQHATGFGPLKIYLIKNILLVVFGILALFVGNYVVIGDIVQTLYA